MGWLFDRGQSAPDVIVDFVFDRGLLFIALRNIGAAPAYSVSVSFDREVRGLAGSKSIPEMPLFRRVEFMPPQKEITTFLDTSASYFRHEQPAEIQTDVVFHDRRGKHYRNRIKHNLDIFRDIGYIKDRGTGISSVFVKPSKSSTGRGQWRGPMQGP